MPNSKDLPASGTQRILLVGRTGSGKTAQIWTLPGKKFAYILDPNSLASLRGLDMDYELFLPDPTELDATLKGFNKGAKDDKPKKVKEPTVYNKWVDDINEKVESNFFEQYDWLIIDSLTFLGRSVMARQLYLNGRYGAIEDLADYRVVGSKMSEIFNSITSLPINLFCTGHISSYQDEKTKKIEVQLNLPGSARNVIPLMFTNIWLAQVEASDKEGVTYQIRTRPEPRGLQDIRNSVHGLDVIEEVTISDFKNAEKYGIGKLLSKD